MYLEHHPSYMSLFQAPGCFPASSRAPPSPPQHSKFSFSTHSNPAEPFKHPAKALLPENVSPKLWGPYCPRPSDVSRHFWVSNCDGIAVQDANRRSLLDHQASHSYPITCSHPHCLIVLAPRACPVASSTSSFPDSSVDVDTS